MQGVIRHPTYHKDKNQWLLKIRKVKNMRFFLIKCISILLSMSLLIGCDRLRDIPAGHGYTAHDLCARILLAKDDEITVWEKYVKPVVIPLDFIGQRKIDRSNKLVTSTNKEGFQKLLGNYGAATSVYREGLGCTNLKDLTAEELQAQNITPLPHPFIALPDYIKWPYGSGGLTESIPDHIDLDKIHDAFSLLFLEEDIDTQEPDNTLATLVAYEGELIAERYRKPFYKNSFSFGWSMSKTITSLLVGIMHDDDLISLDETAYEGWYGTKKADITVKDVLHMASGLDWNEGYSGDSDVTRMLYESSSMSEYVAKKVKRRYKPGIKFNYSTGDTQLLAELIHQKAGGSLQDSYDFYQSRLFYPLGIEAVFEPDESGVFAGGSHAHMKARDWLRIGQLILQRGYWGNERIVSEDWIDMMTTPSPGANYYGAQVWLYDESTMSDYDIPEDVILMRGNMGQLIAIIPSENLVFLKLAASHRNREKMRAEFYRALRMVINGVSTQLDRVN